VEVEVEAVLVQLAACEAVVRLDLDDHLGS
jgi:hypothetical protein